MEQIISKIESYFHNATRKGNEITPLYCPFCNGGSSRDKNTFSFNLETGVYNCLRGNCGEKGNAITLAKHLNIDIDDSRDISYFREVRKEKQYKKPEYIHHDLTKGVIDYFKLRGISQETLIKNKISVDANGNIQFNYYLKDELIFIKYKIPRKPVNGENKSWRSSGAKAILYGMNECDPRYPLIIIEGEPDKLVLDECGIENCVSIPSGTKDMSWIENCWDFLLQFNELILWGDNDKAGVEFVQSAIKRLDSWKLRIAHSDRKDANVVLVRDGKQAVIDIINNARVVNKDFMTDVADVKRKEYDTKDAIPFGFSELDKMVGGTYKGQLSIWTGHNGSGKSTLLSHAIVNGIKDHKTFIYSGELSSDDVKEWLDLQLCGKKNLKNYYCDIKKQDIAIPDPKMHKLLDDYYRNNLFLFDTDDYATDTEVFKAMEYMVKREGVEVIMLDNLLTIPLTGDGTYDEKVTRTVIKLKKFAKKYNVAVHLVAHPRKPQALQEWVTKYDIAGTANLSNLADRVYGVQRLSKKDKEDLTYANYDTVVIVFKDRKFGVFNEEVLFNFHYYSKRFYTERSELQKDYLFNGAKEFEKIEGEEVDWY